MGLRVLVIEDDAFTRLTLTSTLDTGGYAAVYGASSSPEALDIQRQVSPDVALVDLDLGAGPTGIDLAGALRRADPGIGIVFLTSFDDPRLVASPHQQMPAGAQYLVKKNVVSVEVIDQAITESLRSRKVTRVDQVSAGPFGKLTNAQVQTLRLVAQGMSNKMISQELGVTEKAVEQQISRIATRLGVDRHHGSNTRIGIAKAYFRHSGPRDAL